MKKYVFIGIGGFLGAIARYVIRSASIVTSLKNFPFNTLIINVAGSFLLAFILTVFLEVWVVNDNIRLGLTTGFLGAFTTFSTFCKEAVVLINSGDYFLAVFYLVVSVVLGLAAAFAGAILARKIGSVIDNASKIV